MTEVTEKRDNGKLIIGLSGRIDTSNAQEVEQSIRTILEKQPAETVILDCEKLEYISSSGLRVLLRLHKEISDIRMVNVSSEVYEIFEMTGFTEMMKIERAYKQLSIEGCTVIGEGAKGRVYRLDDETCVKVYFNPDSLEDIKRERELARKALIKGVNTAISYDVAKVGDSYASVFELLNARSFSWLIENDSEHIDDYIRMYVDLLKGIHAIEAREGELPDQKKEAMVWAQWNKDYFNNEVGDKIYRLFEEIPENNHMIHGDFHTQNVMFQNGEVILIDMDTVAMGDPIYELGNIYQSFVAYNEVDHQHSWDFLGMSYEHTVYLWEKSLELYMGTTDRKVLEEAENKAKIVAYARLLRRTVRKDSENTKLIDNCVRKLTELVGKVDSLAL
ncbi:MAG: anti-sigma factor antagonist [Erysipelotrichaceae bacterium]|nr:anti-sigma factor antagonist [Erysipelotrichaceae bacterium]